MTDASPRRYAEPPTLHDRRACSDRRQHDDRRAEPRDGRADRRSGHDRRLPVGHVVRCPACRNILNGVSVDPAGMIDGLHVLCRNRLTREEARALGKEHCDTALAVRLVGGDVVVTVHERRTAA